MASQKVQLYIYDLSQGFAAKISPVLIGNFKYTIKVLRLYTDWWK